MVPASVLLRPRTRIWNTVPAAMLTDVSALGTLLVTSPPLSSSLANGVSGKPAPVKTPRTVLKLLPAVSMNAFGASTVNEHGAVHVHHTLGVAPLPGKPSLGSPASAVAPTFDPVAVSAPPPVI